jgi:FAD/FMN-containing dehydrogenase
VTPDGEIVGTGGKTVKNVSGYDISKLMIGSMGSLGILCEMTLRLLPLPECMETSLFSFGSLSEAAAFTNRVFGTKLLPAAVEVMNDGVFKNIPLDSTHALGAGDYAVAIALEAFEEAVARMRADLMDMAGDFGARSSARIMEQEHLRFWLAISNMGPPVSGPASNLIAARLHYPLSKWDTVTALSVEALSAKGIGHTLLAHAGSGVCLVNLLLDGDDTPTMTNAVQAVDVLFKTCSESGGNLVIQRAPTDLKKELPIWGEPGPDFSVMKRIKGQMDPPCIMSPGRFVGGL